MTEPKLRNRTILAVAGVVSGCFEFPVNIGGVFEPHARPDLFADFLFAEEYPPELVSLVRRTDPQRGAIKSIVLGLDPSVGGLITALSRDATTYADLAQSLFRRLAADILRYAKSTDALVKPASFLVKRLVAALELDGYELRGDRLVVREENVFDVVEEAEGLAKLFAKLGLEGQPQVEADLKLTDEHYENGRWGDSIKHARDVMDTTLLGVARAVAVEKGRNLARSALPGVVRTFMKDHAIVSKEENEFLYALYGLLSVQGGHPNMSEKEHARMHRQLALTAVHMILLRYEALRSVASAP
jgi:hypothetical protein